MSTFGGTLVEYERISIDRFDGINVNSTAFFLSHCHRDHMHGLSSKALRSRFRSRCDLKLYASELSCQLLLNEDKYSWLRRYMSALPLETPQTVTVPTDGGSGYSYDVVVTAIPANHCAGSVMFLFEGKRGTVLYTGDFRFAVGHASTVLPLHDGPDGKVKSIRAAYVDTTLCHPDAAYVPTREDSEEALISFFEPKLQAGISLQLNLPGAKLGYETLFESLSRAFGVKVHVSRGQMSRYEGVEDVTEFLTTDPSGTPIHANCLCPLRSKCVIVKPSAMWFAHRVGPTRLIERVSGDFYRLCYSTHASLEEVRDLVRYLKPRSVRANVRVPGLDVSSLMGDAAEVEEKKEKTGEDEPVWDFSWSSSEEAENGRGGDRVGMETERKASEVSETSVVVTDNESDDAVVEVKTVISTGTPMKSPSRLLRTALRPVPYLVPVSKILDDLLL
ncbi:DNA cross-link repair protein snm1 [Haemaphysalis longicornis]